ncbi:MAG: dienelactone hydrolase family protein [Bacteroidetes bacterium]|nr:dienelactone hydrolase family protein [Bacteroidota bacterium]
MIKQIIEGILLLSCISMLYAQGKVKVKSKVRYKYLIYLPDAYKSHSDSTFPVMIYLHGGSHRGNNLELLKEWGPPKLIAEGKHFDFVVVCPQCPSNKLWITDNWFDSLYIELYSKYRIDTASIFVTGISMGGFGTWQVAMDFPGRIKGIVPLCGSCKDSVNICKIRHIPVWAIHGVNDGLVSVKHTDRLVKRLLQCSGDVRYSRLENRHHGIWNLYDTDEIYNWFNEIYLRRKQSLKFR